MKGRKNSIEVVCKFHSDEMVLCTWNHKGKGTIHSIPGTGNAVEAFEEGYSPALLLPQFCIPGKIYNPYKGHNFEIENPFPY